MKTIFENVIKRGTYDLPSLLKKIDSYHVDGKLSDDDRDELYALARGSAKAENGVDVVAKLAALEAGQKALEARVKALENGQAEAPDEPAGEEETVPEYVVGKWYYNGDKISFGGKVYTCTAPDGQVCVWSPAEYPAYWADVAAGA